MCHSRAETHSDSRAFGVLVTTSLETRESDEHSTSLTESADEEKLPSTDPLDEEEGRKGEDGVDNGKNSSEDERQSGLETDVLLEENGRVVDDSVATTELLEELGRSSDESTSHVLLLALLEEVLGGRLDSRLSGNGVGHEVTLSDGNRVVDGGSGKTRDDPRSFSHVAVLHEPSRGLGQDRDTCHHDDGEEDLQSDGESPGNRALHVRGGRLTQRDEEKASSRDSRRCKRDRSPPSRQ